jgi:predicted RNase H-like nuclease (RuvC/YqgF family)
MPEASSNIWPQRYIENERDELQARIAELETENAELQEVLEEVREACDAIEQTTEEETRHLRAENDRLWQDAVCRDERIDALEEAIRQHRDDWPSGTTPNRNDIALWRAADLHPWPPHLGEEADHA